MKPRGEGYFPSSSTSRMVSGGLRPEAGLVLALELERSAAFCTQASCQALRPGEGQRTKPNREHAAGDGGP